jgi:sigma54-dependent transcription regulator
METRSKWTDERLDGRFDEVKGRFDRLESHMDSRFGEVNGRLLALEGRVHSLNRSIYGGVVVLVVAPIIRGIFGV